MIEHTANNDFTGVLYRALLESLIIEVGIGEDVLSTPYQTTGALATQSLVKKTWEFLSAHGMTLKHDINIDSFRYGDTPIMTLFVQLNIPIQHLARLNICHLFLQVYFISQLVTTSGKMLRPNILQGQLGPILNRLHWPVQGHPTTQDWELWRHYLRLHSTNIINKIGQWVKPRDED
jgi:hypothetical protein